ncbi:ThiF family adenylyltransferase [Lacibacter sp.]|uniref:ThiF family adenylyltransferase n=1 Tax=Lacibacter sp. TaxID=1915409 RepID=UPI002B4ABA2A|nr:ThiF family adenylyltransferase [Lacibacter sp.]HLP37744.1 ThiF family adenylyltransferase [Lacibacter sp.]
MLYSESFQEYSGQLPAVIESAIEETKEHLSIADVRILKYSEISIVIPLSLKVNLPPSGAVGGIDIREEERVLLKINLNEYPHFAPTVHPDRKDFPSSFLPHMYVQSSDDISGAFCLVRNDFNEWFGNARVSDVLGVAEQWLFKAASGMLATDGEEFDPLRLEGYKGYHFYKYDMLAEVVSNNQFYNDVLPFALLVSSVDRSGEDPVWRTLATVTERTIEKFQELIGKFNEGNSGRDISCLFSILVWDEAARVDDQYATALPQNYGELRSYFEENGIEIDEILRLFTSAGFNYLKEVPIVHAIRRSKKMVGYEGEYEILNFIVDVAENRDGLPSDDAVVKFYSHIEPFSKELAHKLTGEIRKSKTLYIGGGSLGSKIMMHDVRSGKSDAGVVDHDKFLQHNLVRHVLFSQHIGKNKAEALIGEADKMYKLDLPSNFKSYPIRVHQVTNDEISRYDDIVDTTASFVVENWLTQGKDLDAVKISRCELADSGRLGLLYAEGESRNPRIDDLINLTYYKAKENAVIRRWRRNDSMAEVMNLNVGLGCSSTTTVLSDDVISLHAAIFSKVLYSQRERTEKDNGGLLYRSIMDDTDIPSMRSEYEYVKPFEVLECGNGSGWQLRMVSGTSDKLLGLCKGRKKIETGGVLVGIANYKTKTIHVFEIVVEPQDSKGTNVSFIRGIKGLPENIDRIKEVTGGVIGYVGEWHTHPMDLESLSGVDTGTIEKLKVINRKVPIPTLAVIVTNTKVLPFVFE